MSLTSSLFTVVFLTFVSIPLILSAYITICISILILFLRLSVIYVEFCYAIITNYFVIPTSSNTSLLNFAASEPTTPKRRSIDHGVPVRLRLPKSASYRQLSLSSNQSRPVAIRRHNSSDEHTRKEERSRNSPPPAILSLISGAEGRDFEGVGGWRCPAPGTPSRPRTVSPSSASNNSASDEADERAWFSINTRLELPSQPLPLRNHNDTTALLAADPLSSRHGLVASNNPNPDGRHHRRSATTSMIPNLGRRMSNPTSLAFSNRPDTYTPQTSSEIRPAISPLSQPRHIHIAHFEPFHTTFNTRASTSTSRSAPQLHSHLSNQIDSSGGYFAFRPADTSWNGATTPGTTMSVEDWGTARNMGRFMAHYPAGVRYRRRSMSGVNAGFQLGSPTLGRDQSF